MDVDSRRFITWTKWYMSREAKIMMRKFRRVARKGGQYRTIRYLLRAELKYSGYQQATPAIAWQSDFVLDILLYSYLFADLRYWKQINPSPYDE
jgi:hypothetical protein